MRVDGRLANGGHTCPRKCFLKPPEFYTTGLSHGDCKTLFNGTNWYWHLALCTANDLCSLLLGIIIAVMYVNYPYAVLTKILIYYTSSNHVLPRLELIITSWLTTSLYRRGALQKIWNITFYSILSRY